jgi:glycosyltransferase involved in cell wall biosynthesis
VSDIARKSDAPRPDVHRQAVVSAVIPCLDEEAAIATVVSAVLAQNVSEVVVVDGGSRDGTVGQATTARARVIVEARRGYGRAI